MATLPGIIRSPIKRPFRKVEIKRRQLSDGLYEANWFDITPFVTKWGTLNTSVDDIRINQFVHSGVRLTVKNDYGEFNPEQEGQSFFSGFFTRYRTKIRIQAGYTDGSGNQFPTDATQGIFILDGNIDINIIKNEAILNCKSIVSPLKEGRADEIDGITNSITASEIIEKIRDATDGSGNLIYRQFVSTTSWNIQSTTNILTELGTTTALASFSVWELMNQLAESEGFVIHTTRFGGINFVDRLPNTTSSIFSFFGAGYRRPNIVAIKKYKEAVEKLFTHIRFKYLEDNTETSFITAGTQTTIDVNSTEWKYGRRTYEFENNFISDVDTAQLIVSKLAGEYGNLRSELDMDTEFTPHLEILDPVDVSYREGSINSVMLWDRKNWSSDTAADIDINRLVWASETSGAIDFSKKNFKIIKRSTNLDTFVTTFRLREVEN